MTRSQLGEENISMPTNGDGGCRRVIVTNKERERRRKQCWPRVIRSRELTYSVRDMGI